MIDYVVKDVMEVAGYLPIGIICGIAAIVLYIICNRWRSRKLCSMEDMEDAGSGDRQRMELTGSVRAHMWNVIVWFLFVVYMVVMFITVFLSREPGSRQGIDMTLFGTWGETPQAHAFVIENILLFVPFGILYPVAVPGRWKYFTVLTGMIISVGIETVQLITQRGYCQLDDVVMNTLGSLVGYVIFVIARSISAVSRKKEE